MPKQEAVALEELLAARRPGWTLPQAFYTAPEIHALDVDRVYRRNWIYAGPACHIPNPGDYFLFELASDALIVVRSEDGQVRALHNVCRHRGSRVCLQEQGHARKLVCPYHQWVYACDGSLAHARAMGPDFSAKNFALKQARVGVVNGLIFVALSADAPDFVEFAATVEPYLRPHRFDEAKIAHRETYDCKANWKLIVENSRECYHCPTGHPEYTHIMMKGGEQHACRMEGYEKRGLRTKRQVGPWYHVARYPTGRPEYVTQSLDGRAIAPPMGEFTQADSGVMGLVTFPSMMFLGCGDHAVSFRFVPVSADRTRIEGLWLVRQDAVEGKDYDLAHLLGFWKATGEQDWKLCENNHAGVASSAYEPGPYGEEEPDLERFVRWYLDQIAASQPANAKA
ncbi:MAG: aromatic ring-hydroxylating dioxygenase subunit alpha [Planctomycetes bacterium]|nr:aromatic ring-hydroxylating dioxygenase subunit alpha [Planctomycetota bacterium]